MRVKIGKLGLSMAIGIVLVGAIFTIASAHGFARGDMRDKPIVMPMMGPIMGSMGHGIGVIGMHGMMYDDTMDGMMYGHQEYKYNENNNDRYNTYKSKTRERIERNEVSGEVVKVYPMSIKLDNNYYIRLPWWFIEELDIQEGDSVKAKGYQYGKLIVPVYIEVNGNPIGDVNSSLPIWMQWMYEEDLDEEYSWYGWHCPMMW